MIDIRYSQNAAAWWQYYAAHSSLTELERRGVWLGKSCAKLGWAAGDPVTGEQFACLLDGYSLSRLSCVQRRLPSRRCGYDVVISAPKGVSVAALCWDDSQGREEIQRAFLASTLKLGQICEMLVKRQNVAQLRTVTGNMAAAVFTHQVSRYGDPHLHSHMVIGNLTMISGRWAAIALDTIYGAKRALDRLFNADLVARLRRSGIRASLEQGHCQIPIALELCRGFSKGREKLEFAANKLGLTGRRRAALMAVLNDRLRPKKRPPKRDFVGLLSVAEQAALSRVRRRRAVVQGRVGSAALGSALTQAVLSEGAPTERNRLSAAARVAEAYIGEPIEELVRAALDSGLLHRGRGEANNSWTGGSRAAAERLEEIEEEQVIRALAI